MIVDAKITRFRFSIYRFLFLLVFIFLFALIKSGHAHNGSPWVSVGPLIEAVQQAESADAIKCSREPAQGDPHFSQDAFDL